MDDQIATTPAAIQKAGDHLKQSRPAYDQIVNYYVQIFIEQEAAKNAIQLAPIRIPPSHLKAKLKENLSLIDVSQFSVDKKMTAVLLSRICTITQEAGLGSAESAGQLKSAIDGGRFDLDNLISNFLNQDQESFEEHAANLGIDTDFLWLVTYHGIKPSIANCAGQLAKLIHPDHSHGKGYCPICGSDPTLSSLGKDGQRHLYCGFCWHRWQVKRIYCPTCGNDDSHTLQYFYSDDEKGYRVELCEKCSCYLKCMDLREVSGPIFPPLELVTTLHLDMKAKEAGYRSVSENRSEHGEG